MEPDRFKNNHILYIVGLISLIFSVSLLFFSLYILPYLIWKLNYQVPDTLEYLITIFEESYDYTPAKSKILAWLVFFIPSLLLGLVSYVTSNRIDNEIYKPDADINEEDTPPAAPELRKEIKETASVGFKIIALMVVIVVIILLLQLFFQVTA